MKFHPPVFRTVRMSRGAFWYRATINRVTGRTQRETIDDEGVVHTYDDTLVDPDTFINGRIRQRQERGWVVDFDSDIFRTYHLINPNTGEFYIMTTEVSKGLYLAVRYLGRTDLASPSRKHVQSFVTPGGMHRYIDERCTRRVQMGFAFDGPFHQDIEDIYGVQVR